MNEQNSRVLENIKIQIAGFWKSLKIQIAEFWKSLAIQIAGFWKSFQILIEHNSQNITWKKSIFLQTINPGDTLRCI